MLTLPEVARRLRVECAPRRGLCLQAAAGYVGIGKTLFLEMVDAGEMPAPFKIRSRVLWDIRALDEAIDLLSDQTALDSEWDEVEA